MTAEISAQINRPYLPESGGGVAVEIDVEPGSVEEVTRRHIAICVDSSGSMDNRGKIEQVRDATNLVYGLLNEDDYISLVSFDREPKVLMEGTRWGDIEREEAERRVDRIVPSGGTDIYGGLKAARDTLTELEAGDNVSQRILLLSDGRDTGRNAPDFEPLAEEIAEAGISIYSAGIGTHYDKDVIRTLGEHSQGQWVHVDSPTDIRSFFGDVVQDASTVVANNPELVVEPAAGAEVAEVFRRTPQIQEAEPRYEDGKVVVGLPDLQADEQQTVVMKMDAPGGEVGESAVLATLTLESTSLTASTEVSVAYSDDPEELAQQHDDVFIAHRDTVIRSEIAHADDDEDLDDVKDLVEETEVIADDDQVTADLRDQVTRIEEGDEAEVREVQEQTTVIHDDERFE